MHNPIQVLIVEDELISAENIARHLKRQGYTVSGITDSGKEAIQLAIANPPDLVLIDIMLRGEMDGIETARCIGSQLQIPIIYMTAYGDDATLERAKTTNPSGYLVKPFNVNNLKIAIEIGLQQDRIHKTETTRIEQQLQRSESRLQRLTHEPHLRPIPSQQTLEYSFQTFVQQMTTESPLLLEREGRSQQLPVLCLQIENWRLIKAHFGFQQSEALLQLVVQRLEPYLASEQCIASLSSNELAILLPPTTHQRDIVLKSQQFLQLLQVPFSLNHQPVCLTGKIGVACYPNAGRSLEDLLKLSHNAIMAPSSPAHHAPIAFYQEQVVAQGMNFLELENSLRQAIDHQELQVYYQPKVQIETGKIVGAEALLRWNHSQHGFIAPSEFIPVAEQTGLMIPIGEWVMEQVCRFQRQLISCGLGPLRIAINLSPKQFYQHHLIQQLRQTFLKHQLNPQDFEIEITEDTSMHDFLWSLKQLNALKAMGLTITMDDFGKGYSSLLYLQKLPFDFLKIDKEFVRNIHRNSSSQIIVKTLIEMAHQLRIKVVGEGVEAQEEQTLLRQYCCDEIQGFLINKPIPKADFMTLLLA